MVFVQRVPFVLSELTKSRTNISSCQSPVPQFLPPHRSAPCRTSASPPQTPCIIGEERLHQAPTPAPRCVSVCRIILYDPGDYSLEWLPIPRLAGAGDFSSTISRPLRIRSSKALINVCRRPKVRPGFVIIRRRSSQTAGLDRGTTFAVGLANTPYLY